MTCGSPGQPPHASRLKYGPKPRVGQRCNNYSLSVKPLSINNSLCVLLGRLSPITHGISSSSSLPSSRSPLASFLTRSVFHSELKTWLFTKSFPPTDHLTFYSAQRLDLFAWCVRLSRLLVGFRTHFKSLHFLLLLSRPNFHALSREQLHAAFLVLI